MNLNDYIGKRGENLFRVMVTEFCNGQPLFDETFLGDKHPTSDFMVELLGRTEGPAPFFVQVKATRSLYRGQGVDRRLVVQVNQKDLRKLLTLRLPTFVAGIDIDLGRGYLINASKVTSKAITSIRVAHQINCDRLQKLWQEVDEWYRIKLTPE